jgi:hypothetical protein
MKAIYFAIIFDIMQVSRFYIGCWFFSPDPYILRYKEEMALLHFFIEFMWLRWSLYALYLFVYLYESLSCSEYFGQRSLMLFLLIIIFLTYLDLFPFNIFYIFFKGNNFGFYHFNHGLFLWTGFYIFFLFLLHHLFQLMSFG